MSDSKQDIVLVTGGSGFLGQHIIKHLIEQAENLGIKEIRSVDLKPYKNVLGHPNSKILITYEGDICEKETIENAFDGVGTVFHCAALVTMEYPPNIDELERVNIHGTKNVIDLCFKYNIQRLIFTSCASVNFVPYMGHSTFTIIINQTESKAITPVHNTQKSGADYDKGFLIPGYSSSKLRAEKIVLNSSNTTLTNGRDILQTVALRPPLIYGEGDNHFMPAVLEYLSKHNDKIPRLAGSGGKQQLIYAGNAAWGHICAYKTLKTSPKKITGLPVFLTDETPVNDIVRFIQRIGRESKTMKFETTWWYLPHFLFFFLSFLYEMIIKFILYPIFGIKLKYSLRAISAFTASVIMFNRMRAQIYIDYDPIYDEKQAIQNSAKWYELCRINQNANNNMNKVMSDFNNTLSNLK